MLGYRTRGFHGFNVKYSPYFDSKLAVGTASNFGIVGNGRLYCLQILSDGKSITLEKYFDTQDCIFDLAWSEINENQIVVGCGDGSIKLFDTTLNNFPVYSWLAHNREVFSLSWNLIKKDTFASSSWDGTVKIWNPFRDTCLSTLPVNSCVYSTQFSPHSAFIVSSASSDGYIRLFDLRTPSGPANHLIQTFPIYSLPSSTKFSPSLASSLSSNPINSHPSNIPEALSHDWNKYRDTVLAVAGVDRVIRTFDIRSPSTGPLSTLSGHEFAVRRICWSPHSRDILLSASYDMTCRVWSDGSSPLGNLSNQLPSSLNTSRQIARMNKHTEFVTGIDWCLFGAQGWCASCAWDEFVYVWDSRQFMI